MVELTNFFILTKSLGWTLMYEEKVVENEKEQKVIRRLKSLKQETSHSLSLRKPNATNGYLIPKRKRFSLIIKSNPFVYQ